MYIEVVFLYRMDGIVKDKKNDDETYPYTVGVVPVVLVVFPQATSDGYLEQNGRQLLVVCPHPDAFDGLDFVEYLIDQPVLDIDSSGTGSGKVS